MPRARRPSPTRAMRSNSTLPSGTGRASRCPTGSITSSMYGILDPPGPGRRSLFLADQDHPPDAELVLQHPEFGGEERLDQWLRHLPAFAQRGEQLVGFAFRLDRERERKALELRLAAAVAVGRHD